MYCSRVRPPARDGAGLAAGLLALSRVRDAGWGSTQTIGTTENRNGAVTMSATKNASFAGTVTAVAFADYADPTSPYGTTLSPITLATIW